MSPAPQLRDARHQLLIQRPHQRRLQAALRQARAKPGEQRFRALAGSQGHVRGVARFPKVAIRNASTFFFFFFYTHGRDGRARYIRQWVLFPGKPGMKGGARLAT